MPALQIHNTLTRKTEPFAPRVAGKAGVYVCGPTVYDYFHIGNARTFTTFDLVVRWLRASGYAVTYVRNITDIDDKIMDRARANGEPIEALTERMVQAFVEDSARLNLVKPDLEPRATRYIGPMLEMIEMLEKIGLAYRGGNGDVYYAVRSFPGYGKLSRRNLDELRAGERVAVEAAKRDPLDFVLWKAAKPGEPRWPSAFGDGRPGWHIECSAMACRELGTPFDIHGGGWDLQFPHHENEIAQSEGAFNRKFVNYWMHGAFLNIDQEKMSKSLGNFHFTRDVLDQLDPVRGGEELRFFFLRGHYRSEISYSFETLKGAGRTLEVFYNTLRDVVPEDVSLDWSNPFASRFRDAMNDDFDTPQAYVALYELRAEVNRSKSSRMAGLLKSLGATIGFFQQEPSAYMKGGLGGIRIGGTAPSSFVSAGVVEKANATDSVDATLLIRHPDGTSLDVEAQRREREERRRAGDFKGADEIRRRLDEAGIVIEDKPDGTSAWRRK